MTNNRNTRRASRAVLSSIGVHRQLAAAILSLLAAFAVFAAEPLRPQPLKSGIDFAGESVRKLQADDFANPGMLWALDGEALWKSKAGTAGKA